MVLATFDQFITAPGVSSLYQNQCPEAIPKSMCMTVSQRKACTRSSILFAVSCVHDTSPSGALYVCHCHTKSKASKGLRSVVCQSKAKSMSFRSNEKPLGFARSDHE